MAKMGSLVVSLELQQEQFQKGMDQAARALAKAEAASKRAQNTFAGLQNSMKGMAQAAAAVGAAFAAMKGVESIVKASDALKNLQGSFNALLGDAGRAGDMMGRVFGVVERTGAPLDAVGASMQRLTIAMGSMGASNAQIEKVAETFIQLGKVGGSSAAETAAALQQLGQALASGKLGGDELKSIRENAPLVAEAIASAIGVTSGQLKQLGEDGKLTSDVVANALIAASDKAAAAFAKLPQSFEQATNRLNAQADLAAAAFDKSAGITQTLVTSTDFIATNLKRWTAELESSNNQFSAIALGAKALRLLMEAVLVIFSDVAFTAEVIARSLAAAGVEAYNLLSGNWSALGNAWRDSESASRLARAALDEYQQRLVGLIPLAEQFSAAAGIQSRGAAKPQSTPLKPPAGGGGGSKGKSDAEKEAEALKKRGEALAAAVDSQEAYNQKLREYDELLGKGAITQGIFEKAVAAAQKELTAQGDALKASVDPFFAHKLAVDNINKAYRDGTIEIEHWLKLIKEADDELKKKTGDGKTDFQKQLEALEEAAAKAVGSGIGEFFSDMINGSMTAAEAFNKMVKSIISDIAKLVAEFAATQIIRSLMGGGIGGLTANPDLGKSSLMLAQRPTFNAAASLAGPSTRAGEPAAVTGGAGATGTGGGPWNVTINNNAPNVGVSTRTRDDGGLEVIVEKMRSMLSQDVIRGGNPFSRSLESAYGLGRGR